VDNTTTELLYNFSPSRITGCSYRCLFYLKRYSLHVNATPIFFAVHYLIARRLKRVKSNSCWVVRLVVMPSYFLTLFIKFRWFPRSVLPQEAELPLLSTFSLRVHRITIVKTIAQILRWLTMVILVAVTVSKTYGLWLRNLALFCSRQVCLEVKTVSLYRQTIK
jgi:hypothetical protein